MKQNSHKKTVEKTCLECRLAFRLSAKEKQEIESLIPQHYNLTLFISS